MYKESETLETKSSFTSWKDIIISLSSFANKKGGKVVFGGFVQQSMFSLSEMVDNKLSEGE